MQRARERGIVTLDVGGIDRATAIRELRGEPTDLHKMGYGGTPVLFPEPVQRIDNWLIRTGQRALDSAHLQRVRTALHYRARRGRAR
jgi:hypothetical protein